MNKYIDSIKEDSTYFRRRVREAYGILGFVRFLKGYYLILITDAKMVAMINRHEIFTVKETEMIRLFNYQDRDKDVNEDEKKYKNIFKSFNLTKCFYFSYTYNITIKFQEITLKKIKAGQSEHTKTDVKPSMIRKEGLESIDDHSDTNYNNSSFITNLYQNNEKVKREEFHAEDYYPWNENFLWNYSLINEFFSIVQDKKWILPVIHGYLK